MDSINSRRICVIFFISIFVFGKTQPLNTPIQGNSDCQLSKIRCDTDAKVHTLEYTWVINRLDFHVPSKGETKYRLTSPIFSATTDNKIKWYLKIASKNEDDETFKLTLHLCRDSKPEKVLANTSAMILDSEQNELWRNNVSVHQYTVSTPWAWDIPKTDKLFSGNKLTIFLNITFREDTTNNVFYQHQSSIPECNLLESFASLFENREFADIAISVNDKEFPAHRAILAARSPVFATMFKRKTDKGKKMKLFNITDVNEQVFREMLRYIYTGKCENLDELADGLLVAANKYDLNRLKMICTETLSKHLTVENAANTLTLADQNEANELKSNAIRFIAARYTQVSNTTEWKRIVKTNPEFYHEICQVLSNGS